MVFVIIVRQRNTKASFPFTYENDDEDGNGAVNARIETKHRNYIIQKQSSIKAPIDNLYMPCKCNQLVHNP